MASILKVDKLDPQSGTALEIGTSGDTITVPSGATLDISSATLTPPATLPASSGVNLTALNASNLGSGTVPTARLGSGTASSSTVLYGDQTYKAEPTGGKILQVQGASTSIADSTTSNSFVTYNHLAPTITCASTSSKVFITTGWNYISPADNIMMDLYRSIDGGASTSNLSGESMGIFYMQGSGNEPQGCYFSFLDSPSTTSEITYKVTFRNYTGSTTIVIGSDDGTSTLTLFEIGA
jgi:hypothetical protein